MRLQKVRAKCSRLDCNSRRSRILEDVLKIIKLFAISTKFDNFDIIESNDKYTYMFIKFSFQIMT